MQQDDRHMPKNQSTAGLQWSEGTYASFALASDIPRVTASPRTSPQTTLHTREEPDCMGRSNRRPKLRRLTEVYIDCGVNGAGAAPLNPSAVDRADR